jgi:hypothetical protein
MKLYDAIDTPKQLYLICEYIEGNMLKHILKDSPGKRIHSSVCAKIFK